METSLHSFPFVGASMDHSAADNPQRAPANSDLAERIEGPAPFAHQTPTNKEALLLCGCYPQ